MNIIQLKNISTSANDQMETGIVVCRARYCNIGLLAGKQYCRYHGCGVLGCDNQSPCPHHSCKWKLERQHCPGLRTHRGEYCIQHSCRIDGCLNDFSNCKLHKMCCAIGCSTKLLSADIKYCPHHICGINGCKDGAGMCITHACLAICQGFICGNSKTFPWKKCLYHLTYYEVFESTEYAKVIPRDVIGIINTYIV